MSLFTNFLGCERVNTYQSSLTSSSLWTISSLTSDEEILNTGAIKKFQFEAISKEIILLSLEAHIQWFRLAGSAPILEIKVNKQPVTGELLVNKPLQFTYADERQFSYYQGSDPEAPPYWVLSYSPDYESNNSMTSNYQVLEGQTCLYIFDITKLVKINQVNVLELAHRGEKVQQILRKPIPVALRQVKLLRKSPE